MFQPSFEPQTDNTFRIVHSPLYYSSAALLKKIAAGEVTGKDAVGRLRDALTKYPYQFEAVYTLAGLYTASGDFEKACNVRYKACQRIMSILPEEDEEPLELDWEYRENQYLLLLLRSSAIDHFLLPDFEMAAGMLETLLELDGEDHLEAVGTLAFCYVGLGERELFDAILPDLSDKDAEKIVVRAWAEYTFDGKVSVETLSEFKRDFKAAYKEFTADSHEVTDQYLADIDSEHPSQEARGRLLWLQTEHLWAEAPEFIAALKG